MAWLKKKYQSIFIVGQCIIFTNRSLVGYGSHFILISTVYMCLSQILENERLIGVCVPGYPVIPVKSTDFGGSLPIFLPFLPSYRQPTDLPQSTDFYRLYFLYLWWKVRDKELEFSVFKLSGYL